MGKALRPDEVIASGQLYQDQLLDAITSVRTAGVPFAVPKQVYRVTEAEIVKDVLRVLQGFPGESIVWSKSKQQFYLKLGTHLSHLSPSSLFLFLQPFLSAGSSLRRVEKFLKKARTQASGASPFRRCPTLEAFANAVSLRLKHLRDAALEKELAAEADLESTSVTLLNLSATASWICAGADFLDHLVQNALPAHYATYDAASLSSFILSFLFDSLNCFCLLKDGEEEAYRTLLVLFVGSLWPYMQSLDAWLHEGLLADPFGELFFYANSSLTIQDSAFWQSGHFMRYLPQSPRAVPEGKKEDARFRLSSTGSFSSLFSIYSEPSSPQGRKSVSSRQGEQQTNLACPSFLEPLARSILSSGKSLQLLQHVQRELGKESVSLPTTQTSLFNQFAASLKELLVRGGTAADPSFDRYALLAAKTNVAALLGRPEVINTTEAQFWERQLEDISDRFKPSLHANVFASTILPSLDDSELRDAVYNDLISERIQPAEMVTKTTNYLCGDGCGSIMQFHLQAERKTTRRLFSSSTSLPVLRETGLLSDALPHHKQNKAATAVLEWLQWLEYPVTPSSTVLVQDCFVSFIEKQVNVVGTQLLDKLMGEWHLMEEMGLLRAVYLMGSGDLLQQFSFVLFNKLDRGEPWDDIYELNTMLQESVRTSADAQGYPTLDSLVIKMESRVSSTIQHPMQFTGRSPIYDIDVLESLRFEYKVAWPLELIIDDDTIKKYNQVMCFLLKVKRAKQALDKACRWMWKGDSPGHKQQLLLQMKLMHFVNTLHHYVMDQVLCSSWADLCEGMASARSLDEVIACHDMYLISIQRQCFVAPDKLWTLISSRVKTILGLALEFYSIQRTLFGGGGGSAAVAANARCQIGIDNVAKVFDECIAFLLRVLSFKLNVGHFPHLMDLISRINYNNYYISESGQLLTPIPDLQQRARRS